MKSEIIYFSINKIKILTKITLIDYCWDAHTPTVIF